jgi:hypothetical protein
LYFAAVPLDASGSTTGMVAEAETEGAKIMEEKTADSADVELKRTKRRLENEHGFPSDQ